MQPLSFQQRLCPIYTVGPLRMPSQVPRSNTTNKREQLERREQELAHALRSGFLREKLVRAAENLRAAQLSLLKAELYWTVNAKIRGREVDERVTKIQDETRKWAERSVDEILHDHML